MFRELTSLFFVSSGPSMPTQSRGHGALGFSLSGQPLNTDRHAETALAEKPAKAVNMDD
jgi:hypothetical protein